MRPYAPHEFGKNENGGVVAIFAIALVPIAVCIAAAIDYGRATKTKSDLQASLDAAILATVNAPADQRQSVGERHLAAAMRMPDIAATFATAADGTISATANTSIATHFGGWLGIDRLTIGAGAQVANLPQPPVELTFTALGAQGWYWKQIDLVIQKAGASTETIVASYVYQPTNKSNSSGTLTTRYDDGAGNLVAGEPDRLLRLPENYRNLYLMMTVYEDGCGPGMVQAADSTDSAFKCAATGSTYKTQERQGRAWVTVTKVYPAKTTGATIYTTDPRSPASRNSAHNLFVEDLTAQSANAKTIKHVDVNIPNGRGGSTARRVKMAMLPNGKTPTIFDLLPCPSPPDGLVQQWEDTPWNSASDPPSSWYPQDFSFLVKASACKENANYTTFGGVTGNAGLAQGKAYLTR